MKLSLISAMHVKGGGDGGEPMAKNGEKWRNFFMRNRVKKLGNSPFSPILFIFIEFS